jgi:hypothetical protein
MTATRSPKTAAGPFRAGRGVASCRRPHPSDRRRRIELDTAGPAGATSVNTVGGTVFGIIAGAVLRAWIVAQVAVTGLRSPLQPVMAGVGVSRSGLGRRLA